MYIELHSRSAFSFLEGSTLPEDLISVCAARGMSAMGLLDRDGLYGSPRFYLAAQKAGLKAHIGAEVSCEAFSLPRHFSPQRHRDTEKTTEETIRLKTRAGNLHGSGLRFGIVVSRFNEFITDRLLVGATDAYEARCRLCFEPPAD